MGNKQLIWRLRGVKCPKVHHYSAASVLSSGIIQGYGGSLGGWIIIIIFGRSMAGRERDSIRHRINSTLHLQATFLPYLPNYRLSVPSKIYLWVYVSFELRFSFLKSCYFPLLHYEIFVANYLWEKNHTPVEVEVSSACSPVARCFMMGTLS